MLEVQSVCAWYDEVQVLHDVTVEVKKGEVVAVLGANGAARPLLRTISGAWRGGDR